MPIEFYSTRGPYGCFSNFSRHSFDLDGAFWTTREHYFQAQKFGGDEDLVEASPVDAYWGTGWVTGADGTGRNVLGRILMETRATLRG